MSGRIRSIKPEILDDEQIVQLSDAAWRLWVSLWVLADDFGNVRFSDRYVAANVWQDTGRDVAPIIQELVDARRVIPYTSKGQKYAHIRSFEKHQRIDNRGKPKVPSIEEAETEDQTLSVNLAASRGESPRVAEVRGEIPLARPRAQSGGGKGGEWDLDLNFVPVGDTVVEVEQLEPNQEPEPDAPTESRTQDRRPDEVWEHYVATTKANRPRRRPTKLDPKDRREVLKLLRAGLTVEDLKRAVTGLFLSQHHLGNNDRSTEYLEFEYALRKPQQFMALADDADPPAPVLPFARAPDEPTVDPSQIDQTLSLLVAGARK